MCWSSFVYRGGLLVATAFLSCYPLLVESTVSWYDEDVIASSRSLLVEIDQESQEEAPESIAATQKGNKMKKYNPVHISTTQEVIRSIVEFGDGHSDKGSRSKRELQQVITVIVPELACASEYVDCVHGFVRGADGNPTTTTCSFACGPACCDGYDACSGFTGKVCKDNESCNGYNSCTAATIPFVANSCTDARACAGSLIPDGMSYCCRFSDACRQVTQFPASCAMMVKEPTIITASPTTNMPTAPSTASPTTLPTSTLTAKPTSEPSTVVPSVLPTTTRPTNVPTLTAEPTSEPSTVIPSVLPTTTRPTNVPTLTSKPTAKPSTVVPSVLPMTTRPTNVPTLTSKPTAKPSTVVPSVSPTTTRPTNVPTLTSKPTAKPSTAKPITNKPLTKKPTLKPTKNRSTKKPRNT